MKRRQIDLGITENNENEWLLLKQTSRITIDTNGSKTSKHISEYEKYQELSLPNWFSRLLSHNF
jgi:hypothetical protein